MHDIKPDKGKPFLLLTHELIYEPGFLIGVRELDGRIFDDVDKLKHWHPSLFGRHWWICVDEIDEI